MIDQVQGNKKTTRLPSLEIYDSWKSIINVEQLILFYSYRKDWDNVIKNCDDRKQFVNVHFEEFPIGPGTAFFYRQTLNKHVYSEKDFADLRKDAVKSRMRLVK